MREDRNRDQWFKIGDQVRFVPKGKIAEECDIDTRSAVELPGEPKPFERHFGTRGRFVVNRAARDAHVAEASRRRGDWHRETDARLAALEASLAAIAKKNG